MRKLVIICFLTVIGLITCTTNSSKTLKVGDIIPNFSLLDENSKKFSSESLKGNPSVIYFYPKDNSRVCTDEACSFRDEFSNFRKLNVTIIGISSDSSESHKAFKEEHNLPFTLLADTKNEVRKLFAGNVKKLPKRITYVVNDKGIIQHIFEDKENAEKHIHTALEQLNKQKF